jgi:lysozyme family protein
MDETFARAVGYLLQDEGLHRPEGLDPGGDTWYGLARNYHQDLTPWPPSKAQAIEHYHQQYWLPYHLDDLPAPVAYAVFDGLVQHDRSAVRILQTCVGTTVDGVVGPQTTSAVCALDPEKLVKRFLVSRARYYTHLGNWEKEGNGWLNRLFAVHTRCLRWTAHSPSIPSPSSPSRS